MTTVMIGAIRGRLTAGPADGDASATTTLSRHRRGNYTSRENLSTFVRKTFNKKDNICVNTD